MAALRGEPTGAATGFRADVIAIAKHDLAAGEVLDGEGGFMVYGKLMPAPDSLALGGLPIGLAQQVTLSRPVKAGTPVTWADVAIDETSATVRLRREMEAAFCADPSAM
jgi:predicted homoserine dehydrogenase-like protein